MLTFAAAIFLLLITPGPGVLSLAGVGSAYGYRPGLAYGVGLFLGSNAVMAAAALGLAAAFLANDNLRLVFTAASSAYLLYLAARIAFAGSGIGFIDTKRAPGVMGGIALQAINPKAYAVGTFVFANFPFWPSDLTIEIALKFLILNAVWIPIHLLWLAAGATIHKLDLQPRTQRYINRAMALSMVIVVGLALYATFYADVATTG